MKLKNILLAMWIFVLGVLELQAQNTNPVVSNIEFSIVGTTVTVTYNVTDAVQTTVTIIMLVSSNNGSTWDYNYGTATGDIGTNVSVGSNKTIQWTYNGGYNPNFKIRIYANDETADGNPCPGVATVVYGGKTYNTIQIGTQCWLKENLDVGTRINGSQEPSNDGIIEKYCYYDLDANCTTYGGLYAWKEAMEYSTTPGNRGICPEGWHIPTLGEYQTLYVIVDGHANALTKLGLGTQNGIGTNTSGFTSLNPGYAHGTAYQSMGGLTSMWSSSGNSSYAWKISWHYYSDTIYLEETPVYYTGYRMTIRCIKNN